MSIAKSPSAYTRLSPMSRTITRPHSPRPSRRRRKSEPFRQPQ
jgi:hypothetical protein